MYEELRARFPATWEVEIRDDDCFGPPLNLVARLLAAGLVAAVTARLAVPAWPPLLSLLAHGTLTVVLYGLLLWLSGFMRTTERTYLAERLRRWRARSKKNQGETRP